MFDSAMIRGASRNWFTVRPTRRVGWFAYCRAGRADRVEPAIESLLGRKPIALREFVRDHADRWR